MWWIIIVAIIITFVWWGSNTSQGDRGSRGGGNLGVINGQEITPTLFDEAAREVRLSFFYGNNGRWPSRAQVDLEGQTYQRLLLLQKVAAMGIHVSDDAVAQIATARMRAVNRGNPVPLAEFEKQVLGPERLTIVDFERFIRNELAIQQLVAVLGAGGELATPQEVEALYRREYQELSAQVVFFRATNYSSNLTAPADKVAEFYTNRLAAYRLPDRVQVQYVSYPLSNYLATAQLELDKTTNLTEIIEAYYEQMGSNYFGEATTPAAAKESIRADFLKRGAMNAAAKDARKLDDLLYSKEPYTLETFGATAKELGLTAQVTAPFSADAAPAGLGVDADFARRAFGLTMEQPLTEPLAGENHLYVIGYLRQLPSENPPLESIRDRVAQDYLFVESALKAEQAALTFHAMVTNGLAAGKTFAALCADAAVKPVALAPFSPSTRNIPEIEKLVEAQNFRRVAFATASGQIGAPMRSADGAALVFVAARLPIDETALATNLPAFTRNVQQMRRGEVFDQWFSQEANKVFATIPYFQQKQAQMSGAPAKQ